MSLQMKQLRVRKGYKQGEVAQKLDMPTRRYGSYEREERAISLVDAARVADVLECTLDELAGRDFRPSPDILGADEREVVDAYRIMDEAAQRRVRRAVKGEVEDIDRGGAQDALPSAPDPRRAGVA